jgi:hypothetical protein
MARGKHLFPFRTEKLSPSAPMVLGSQGPGRVGRRRFVSNTRTSVSDSGGAHGVNSPACARRAKEGQRTGVRLLGACGRRLRSWSLSRCWSRARVVAWSASGRGRPPRGGSDKEHGWSGPGPPPPSDSAGPGADPKRRYSSAGTRITAIAARKNTSSEGSGTLKKKFGAAQKMVTFRHGNPTPFRAQGSAQLRIRHFLALRAQGRQARSTASVPVASWACMLVSIIRSAACAIRSSMCATASEGTITSKWRT